MIDILIIGSGGAGLRTALSAKTKDNKVVVLSKSYPTRSQTSMAQGGINAALSNKDSIQNHYDDTYKSAKGLGDKKSIDLLSKNAPAALEYLDSIGMPFSRNKEGKIAQRQLGGASYNRACYAQDYTGLKLLHTLYDQALKEDIEFINEHYLLNLIHKDNVVLGALVLDIRTSKIKALKAKAVVLATGGYAKIYHAHTSNSEGSTGDGIAAALRSGVEISDIEFLQFHPTALKKSGLLISESARGAGGYLLNAKKQRFTNELASRDLVSRAIYEEIEKTGEVFLDIRHLGEEFIQKELPQERKLAKLHEGIDPAFELIPIKPVAHYSMGGIAVNSKGQTTMLGLYAVGECANTYVHGANRLGGNSLLELLVFGQIVGQELKEYIKKENKSEETKTDQYIVKEQKMIDQCFSISSKISFYEKRDLLGSIMYEKMGIIRDEKNMFFAKSFIEEMNEKILLMGLGDKSKQYNSNLIELLEFRNSIDLANIMINSALLRKESRGAHYRSDKPTMAIKNQHTIITKDKIWLK
jgi:succinate dehydrogenase / fumarate reductase flavoprotein subunit